MIKGVGLGEEKGESGKENGGGRREAKERPEVIEEAQKFLNNCFFACPGGGSLRKVIMH